MTLCLIKYVIVKLAYAWRKMYMYEIRHEKLSMYICMYINYPRWEALKIIKRLS